MGAVAAHAQTRHFVVDGGGDGTDNEVIVIQSFNPTIDGVAMKSGDEVAVFDTAGHCYGAGVWTGPNSTIDVPVNAIDPESDTGGFNDGDTMYWRVWDSATSMEMPAVATYQPVGYDGVATAGDSTFSSNGLAFLASLTASSTPLAPKLLAPASGALGQPVSPTLQWNVGVRALVYLVQVSTTSSFSPLAVVDSAVGNTDTTKLISGLSNISQYYWRIASKNNGGTVWSSAWSFTTTVGTPVLSSPANGATNQPNSLTLSWSAVTGATAYSLQVSTVSTFATTFSSQTALAGTTFALNGLKNAITYYWEVNASASGSAGPWTAYWSFTVVAAPPAAPTLSLPANGAANQSVSLNLSWGSVSGALQYSVQVSTTSAFATTVSNLTGLTSTTTPAGSLANGQTYYWHANAVNAAGPGCGRPSGVLPPKSPCRRRRCSRILRSAR